MPTLSYLVTSHNETSSLQNLLAKLTQVVEDGDEIIILDDFSTDPQTQSILNTYSQNPKVKVVRHELNSDYGYHKNYGTANCTKEWVFQIDGDELPSDTLLVNVKSIIEENPEIEVMLVPRMNAFKGLTQQHATAWGWVLTKNSAGELMVNWPDYQGRIYKNDYPRIHWERRLHEQLAGYTKFSPIPAEEDLALIHDKTIETQIATNIRYNKMFSEADNRGHQGYK